MAAPRVVVVTRPSDYEALLARHGTHEQARFFLERRGQDINDAKERDAWQRAVLDGVSRAIPSSRVRRSNVTRADLSRFLFEPDDVVVCVGQDGLVANVAKYLSTQHVIGINADPSHNDGVLVRHKAGAAKDLLGAALGGGRLRVEKRTMVEAITDDGVRLVALNEIYAGHRTHQSARYRLRHHDGEERQSSSGVVVSTGTGATGWARSIALGRSQPPSLPKPSDPSLVFFVREAFPSIATGTNLVGGAVDPSFPLTIVSEMNEGGTLFGDGIEDDAVDFRWGLCATIRPAKERLHLVL